MKKLCKMIENQVCIRGSLRSNLWLQLDFFLAAIADKGKAFFKVHCVLDYQSDSETFWYEPALRVEVYDNFEAIYGKELFAWRDRKGNVSTESCMILNDMRYSVDIPSNHPQLLQTFAYLCSELFAKSYELKGDQCIGPDSEVYTLLGHRLEGYVQSCNREFLNTMRMRPLK